VAEDITEVRELEERYRQSQKMEAFGQLAGGIAHDFNNILAVLQGHAELLTESIREGDPIRDSVDAILRVSRRASGLTRQLLAFSRKQVLQPRVLDLKSVVHDVTKMLRHLIGEDIELRIE